MSVIATRYLSKKYPVYRGRWDKVREMIGVHRAPQHEFWAIRDVSFEVEAGQTLGIIGRNGSGKSTLLQILAGIMRQTRGDCHVEGKVAALLELGSGFNPEFTGRENVFMNGAILGLDSPEIEKRFASIARFAEIGTFMEQPVKTYSTGMFLRLAFAVAVHVDPDVLLVDEALAVGDLVFQHRCLHRMNQLKESGKTIVLVTHDLGAITKFCDRALLLEDGQLLEDSKPDRVVQKYRALVFERERRGQGPVAQERQIDSGAGAIRYSREIPVVRTLPNVDHRFGNQAAALLGIELLDAEGKPTREVFGGQWILIRISALFDRSVERPIIGYTLRDRLGIEISATNTLHCGNPLPRTGKGQLVTSEFTLQFPPLAPGSYSLSPAVAEGNLIQHDMCDWIDNALVFELRTTELIYGMLKMEVQARSYVQLAPDSSVQTERAG